MASTQVNTNSGEWIRILDKGMVTIPKDWRDELGLTKGEIVKAQKVGNKVIIQAQQDQVPYRVYSAQEVAEFVRQDRLPGSLQEKVRRKLKSWQK